MVAWPGREGLDEFSSRVQDKCSAMKGMAHIKGMIVKGRGGEDRFNADLIDKYTPIFLNEEWRKLMPTQVEMLSELTSEVRSALDGYRDVVTTFRGAVKNDISSAKASAVAIEENMLRMRTVYKDTAAMLTSPEFMLAIENAERMATALKAVSELQSHSITFAVLDKKSAA